MIRWFILICFECFYRSIVVTFIILIKSRCAILVSWYYVWFCLKLCQNRLGVHLPIQFIPKVRFNLPSTEQMKFHSSFQIQCYFQVHFQIQNRKFLEFQCSLCIFIQVKIIHKNQSWKYFSFHFSLEKSYLNLDWSQTSWMKLHYLKRFQNEIPCYQDYLDLGARVYQVIISV